MSPAKFLVVIVSLGGLVVAPVANAATPTADPEKTLLVSGLAGGSGSTVGPGGDLYVTEAVAGRISRVDPRTGEVTTVATGLPETIPAVGFGGVVDVAFLGGTAYALVTLVGDDVGGTDVVGIYRIDGPDEFTLVADIGAFAQANPPETDFFVPTGVQYALQAFRGGFLVTDGHHNRVLWVTRGGDITEVLTLPNTVPTGLEVHGRTVYVAQAGPVPHLPEDGRILGFRLGSSQTAEVASGGRLLVDVERGRGRRLFALSQGVWLGGPEGSPATPDTGQLLEVTRDGAFRVVADDLDRPTSLEIIGTTAYVVTLDGEIWQVEDVAGPPYGRRP